MPYTLIKRKIDITHFPEIEIFDGPHKPTITVGDLHANTLKLLHLLVTYGVLALKNGEQDYARLAEIFLTNFIYLSNEEVEQRLDEYEAILDVATFSHTINLSLLGDELADRGNNDYLTLYLFKKLVENNIKFEILASNHGLAFLESYRNNFQAMNSLYTTQMEAPFCRSLVNLGNLVQRGIVGPEYISELVEKYYLPNLKLLNYFYNEKEDSLYLKMHAYNDPEHLVKGLADKYGVNFSWQTNKSRMATIDAINKKAQATISQLTVTEGTAVPLEHINPLEHPIDALTWNRCTSLDGYHDELGIDPVDRGYPYTHLFVIHGHDEYEPSGYENTIFNLDNKLGKDPRSTIGEDSLFVFIPSPLEKKLKSTRLPLRQHSFFEESRETIKKKKGPTKNPHP